VEHYTYSGDMVASSQEADTGKLGADVGIEPARNRPAARRWHRALRRNLSEPLGALIDSEMKGLLLILRLLHRL